MVEIGTEILQKAGNAGVSVDKGGRVACDGIAGKGIMRRNVRCKTSQTSGQRPSGNLRRYMNRKILSGLICFIAVLSAYSAYAEQGIRDDGTACPFIYGHYRQGEGWSWYGAKRIVKTPVEAREIIERIVQTKDVRVLRITDQPHFFVGEIINKNGNIVDRVLIDKRTGRIRSMY